MEQYLTNRCIAELDADMREFYELLYHAARQASQLSETMQRLCNFKVIASVSAQEVKCSTPLVVEVPTTLEPETGDEIQQLG